LTNYDYYKSTASNLKINKISSFKNVNQNQERKKFQKMTVKISDKFDWNNWKVNELPILSAAFTKNLAQRLYKIEEKKINL
jgi:hypothetical protein